MNQSVHSARRRAAAADTHAEPVGAAAVKGRAAKTRARGRAAPAAPRTNDPERTMADILEVATREFAENGLAGARVDVIAEAMRTSKRMIYYYFGSKEGLYLAALEEAYRRIRAIEADLHLEDLAPEPALRRLVAFTMEYQAANPDFVRLVMTENIHRGQYLKKSRGIQRLNVPAIEGLRRVYERGVQAGVFRAGLDPVELHWAISAFAIFNVANKHTFSIIFQRDMDEPRGAAARRELAAEMLVRYVRR
ncbi:MAG: TetR family transcriptional regulator [Rubrivivax sp.]|nr:TetR family transcriptional regulator [Rubrivivax sp.]